MEEKQLVDQILGLVLEKMKLSQSKPRLLILNQDLENSFCKKLESTGIQSQYQLEDSLSMNQNCRLEDYEACILPGLSTDLLGKLSGGIGDSPFLLLAVRAILTGKRVYIPLEEVELYRYQETAPSAYYVMMLEKINFLKSCNVVFCRTEELGDVISNISKPVETVKNTKKNQADSSCEPKSVRIEKRVITEKDVEQAWTEGASVICIGDKAILSDLAKELAGSRKIQFQRSSSLERPGRHI